MRTHALFTALTLLISLASASQSPLESFLNKSFEPDQKVELRALASGGPFAPQGGPFYLVIADGVETYVLDGTTGKPIEAPYIGQHLESDARNATGYDAKLSSVLSFPQQALDAKNYTERKCMQYTGTDMHECFDKLSCTLACFAVPLCSTPLYSDGFWEAMLDWTKGRKAFGSLLANYSESLGTVGSYVSVIDHQSAMLDAISAQAQNISRNPLFLNRTDEGCAGGGSARCFEFCPKIDYSLEMTKAAKQNLASLRAAVIEMQKQPARADALWAASMANNDYLSTRGMNYQAFRLHMLNAINRLKKQSGELSKNLTDPSIQPALDSLSSISASVDQQGEAGLYRKALSQQPEFEKQSSGLESRMASDASAISSLFASSASLLERVGKSEELIGSESAEAYRQEIAAAQDISAQPTLEQIASAKLALSGISQRLTEEIAARAVGESPPGHIQPPASQPEQQPNKTSPYPQPQKLPGLPRVPSSFPCAPALVMLALVGFAASRKGSD